MAPGITNSFRPFGSALFAPEAGGIGAGVSLPASTLEEQDAALQQQQEQAARSAVAAAFAGASGVEQMVGVFAREPAKTSTLFATLSDICDEPRYSEHFGAHINIPSKTPRRWLEDGAVTKQTVTTAKTLGWNAVKHNDALFLLPPSSVLGDIVAPRDYQLLADAGVASHVLARGGRGPSNLDLLEMELFDIAPAQSQGIFHPDNYLFRSLEEAFGDSYLLVNLNDTNFLIREEFLSQDAKWTLLRLKTAGVAHVRGVLGLEGDDKSAPIPQFKKLAIDDVVSEPSGGELDLEELQVRQWERWGVDPRAVVDLSKYEWLLPHAELHDWLQANLKYIEHGDIERLSFYIAAAKISETVEALDAIISNMKGTLAEIAARPKVHAEYLELQKAHEDLIMLVAPQIHDGNILEASDAIIGEIVADGSMKIYSVWEITSSNDRAQESRAQLDDTLKRRFAKSGIQIRGEQQRGSTLKVVLAEGVAKNVLTVADQDIMRIVSAARAQMLIGFEEEYIVSKGIEIRRSTSSRYSTATLIEMLRLLAVKVGHTPTVDDLQGSVNMPSVRTYVMRFGAFSAAHKAAGLKPNRDYFTKEGLLLKLKAFAVKLGHVPTQQEIDDSSDMPCALTYSSHFGTFSAALKAIGLKPNQEYFTNEVLLFKLKAFAKKLGRTPTQQDLKDSGDMPSEVTYQKHFGTFSAALKAIGLKPNQEYFAKEELILKLKAFAEKLGRTPTVTDLDGSSDMPSSGTYMNHFGSFGAALKAAGFKPNREYFGKEALLLKLKAFAEKLGRTPTRQDLADSVDIPCVRTYANHFGTFAAALEAAGLKPNRK